MIQQEHGADWVQVATFIYTDGLGREVARVLRYEPPDRGPKKLKQLRPIHCDGGSWSIGDPAGQWPLYRLADLNGSQRVFIVEGEGKVDALRSLGLSATTSAHGSKAAAKTDWQPLAGRDVVILPDADDAGQHYAETVARILNRVRSPAMVRILHLPDLPPGGDICEFIEDRRTDAKDDLAIRTEIEDLAALVTEYVPAAEGDQGEGPRPVMVRLSDVQPEPVRWLWPGRIALGKVAIIVGDPGLGKSFITLDMAARISRGTPWPDAQSEANPVGGTVLLSAEDDIADTIRPRLDAAGADVSRIVALRAVQHGEGAARMFNLATDLEALERAIRECEDCRLVVVDPITAYLGKIDSHKNADIRGLLAPLAEMAGRLGVAIVAVSHLNKSGTGPAMYRTMGSLAFVAAARAVWAVTKDKEDPTRRLVLPVKNNLAPDKGGLAYSLLNDDDGIPRVFWDAEPVSMTADEALNDDGEDERSEREAAAEWLRDALAAGPMPAKDVKGEAKENSIAERTLKRAKKDIGAEARRLGFGQGATWYWALPGTWDSHRGPSEAIGGQPQDVAPYGEVGPLRDKPADRGGGDSPNHSEMGALL
ncbi:MAG: AAA family ATPase [Planctomycetes bacterium]|nr:AAA family ATPase [Planctomycetota bacterium]